MATLSITVKAAGTLESAKTDALIVLLPDRKTLPTDLKALDSALNSTLGQALKEGGLSGRFGASHSLPGAGAIVKKGHNYDL